MLLPPQLPLQPAPHPPCPDSATARPPSLPALPHSEALLSDPVPPHSTGLAESTLFVTGGDRHTAARRLPLSIAGLHKGVAEPPRDGADAREYVSCGHGHGHADVRIVDPVTARACPEGRVGEVWVRGGSVADGYWRLPDDAFTATLAGGGDGDGDGDGPYLRTGDLGVMQVFCCFRKRDALPPGSPGAYGVGCPSGPWPQFVAGAAGLGPDWAQGCATDRRPPTVNPHRPPTAANCHQPSTANRQLLK